ncbi:L-threonylcarbamoyladenylate synthase [Chromobacterium vaccinii]|uniref:L-threonylcarbamoyladenylate synthase n=1 Tax=Chromobacterium piscinae TaxID=686831 RepID=UPI001C8B88BE|nr:threonylcarbamoyl-AMP synthase [Chromobacterium vaccinii]MBX9349267.1 threonylcarbamoyl-AMP synthase [Chromobacterium vaccinii]MBX9356446.1 threonylcarbamoyl-AMP synthase [Chromobacterium vaccinii]
MKSLSPTPEGLDQAAALLRAGELVAVPTETVYGLAADATQPDAVAAIFRAKNRPADHPLIVHLPGLEQLNEWASRVPDCAWPVIERFWPGPLTLVLPASEKVPAIVNAGQDTVALRWSSHPLLQALLDRLRRPVAAPSANPFCRISPTTADHVRANMEGRIAAVVDGGPCAVGIESTILDLSGARPAILRPGAVTAAMLAPFLDLAETAAPDAPRVPGNLASHYAPRQPCYRLEAAEAEERADDAGWRQAAVLAIDVPAARCGWFKRMPSTQEGYAQALYAALHEADASGCPSVWIVLPPDEPAWRAVRDRLQRAARPLDGRHGS